MHLLYPPQSTVGEHLGRHQPNTPGGSQQPLAGSPESTPTPGSSVHEIRALGCRILPSIPPSPHPPTPLHQQVLPPTPENSSQDTRGDQGTDAGPGLSQPQSLRINIGKAAAPSRAGSEQGVGTHTLRLPAMGRSSTSQTKQLSHDPCSPPATPAALPRPRHAVHSGAEWEVSTQPVSLCVFTG